MGLDMYLYKISKPKRDEGFLFDSLRDVELENETFLSEETYEMFPDDYKHYLIKGQVKQPVALVNKIIERLVKVPITELVVEKTGSSSSNQKNTMSFLVSRSDKEKLNIETGTTIIEETDDICIFCECEWRENYDKFALYITYQYKTDDALLNYKGKYIDNDVYTVYAVLMNEIDYQRKGLNDKGWAALPENCSYCGDRKAVEYLCKEGGLDMSFLDNWEDGNTLFLAWW